MVPKIREPMLGALLLLLTACCLADVPPEVVQHAKQATALVQVESGEGRHEGTAFCIDASGLFITNAHVVKSL